jgi:putative ABC transport system ATP-binding protein
MLAAMAPPQHLIALEGVSRVFDGGAVVALREVDLHLKAGECLAILGASGSGKSSLINMMSGIDAPTSGRVTWCGEPVASRKAWAQLRRQHIGIVFQEFNLLPTLTAIENVEIALFGRGLAPTERRARAAAALERVGLGSRLAHPPHALSGGERQRVAIARSVVNAPKLLLADEPTGNLDSTNAAVIADLLIGLQESSEATLVLVTHDETLARRCRRQIRIKDGTIVEDRTWPHAAPRMPKEATA